MLIDDVVINTFYLKECKGCRLRNVILEKWDSRHCYCVFGQHTTQQYLEFAHCDRPHGHSGPVSPTSISYSPVSKAKDWST